MLPFAFPKPLFEFEAERPQIEPLFALLPTYSNLVQSTLCTSRRCLVMLFLHFVLFFLLPSMAAHVTGAPPAATSNSCVRYSSNFEPSTSTGRPEKARRAPKLPRAKPKPQSEDEAEKPQIEPLPAAPPTNSNLPPV